MSSLRESLNQYPSFALECVRRGSRELRLRSITFSIPSFRCCLGTPASQYKRHEETM